MFDDDYLKIGNVLGIIAGLLTFIGSWWYCAAEYGFLLGFGLGWLPSGIAAVLVYLATLFLWGLVFAGIAILIVIAINQG